jgi:acetate kinase
VEYHAIRAASDILCLNCGSSSLKFSIYTVCDEGESLRDRGSVEGIGLGTGELEIRDERGMVLSRSQDGSSDHGAALELLLDALPERGFSRVDAAGHRVVHGGPDRTGPARVDSALLDELRARIPLAPLHLPQEIRVIEATAARWPGLPMVACFDTAFHRRMPEIAQRLPLSRGLFDEGVRRYGYHGLSYEYVLQTLGEDARGRVIIAHLGNGSSLAALRDGRPIDTTMGFTPTGGVVMGTRSGDLDPGVLLHLLDRPGWDAARLDRLVNREAGLLGVSGLSADMRRLLELRASDADADQAIRMFCRSVRKAIGALATDLGGLDLLVFTGGIGERAPTVRREICEGLEHLGVLAADGESPVAAGSGTVRVRVVPTQENLMIARQTRNLLFRERA